MRTQYYAASSLDGYLAAPGHSLDWLLQFDSVENTSYPSFISDVGAIAMGSNSYEWLLRHQSGLDPNLPNEWPYKQPVWVFTTRSLPTVSGADIRFVQGDVKIVHDQMVAAAAGKNIWILGGGDLAGQFYDRGLLDEIIVQVAPVTLGSGVPFFPRGISSSPLRLKSAIIYGETFVEIRYEVPRPNRRVDYA